VPWRDRFLGRVKSDAAFFAKKTSDLGILTAVVGEEFFFDQTVTMPIQIHAQE